MPNSPKNIANALRREIQTAPAGGTFHGAEQSDVTVSVAPKTATFVLIDGNGKAFKVAVSEL